MDEDVLLNGFLVISTATTFSGIGVLIFLAIKSLKLPMISPNVKSYGFQFVFTVISGVVTYFITDWLFGHGTDKATITGITTAIIIGTVIKLLGGDSDTSGIG